VRIRYDQMAEYTGDPELLGYWLISFWANICLPGAHPLC
jgi:hypothetical protein